VEGVATLFHSGLSTVAFYAACVDDSTSGRIIGSDCAFGYKRLILRGNSSYYRLLNRTVIQAKSEFKEVRRHKFLFYCALCCEVASEI